MSKLRVLDLFSGIGGFSLGLERTGGFETVAFCEIEEFPRKVLKKHWPKVPCYEDVRTLTAATLAADGIAVDVITGGFPCQDISTAGKQAGIGSGTRSGLYSEIIRLTRDLQPQYVIMENVANLLSGPPERRGGWFGRVLGDLAEIGYDAEWHRISAANLGAHQIRDRAWVLAHPMRVGHIYTESSQDPACYEKRDSEALERRWSAISGQIVPSCKVFPDSNLIGLPGSGRAKQQMRSEAGSNRQASGAFDDGGWPAEPSVGRMAHGVPNGMDRIAALGNAVVPQITEMIGRAILESRV